MKTGCWCIVLLILTVLLFFPSLTYGDESGGVTEADLNFQVPDDKEKSKIEILGNFEGELLSLNTNEDSILSNANKLSDNYFDLYLQVDYQTKDWGAHFKSLTDLKDLKPCLDMYEAYININLSESTSLDFGKRIYNWGKGYAFNVVGFVNPIRSPISTENTQREEGLYSLSLSTVKSFDRGVIKNMAADFIVVFPQKVLEEDTSDFDDYSIAAKVYFLLGNNIDLDLMAYYNFKAAKRVGMDISYNLLTNVELHGEAAYSWNDDLKAFNGYNINNKQEDGLSFLVGAKVLTSSNTTLILEYLHNGLGLNPWEYAGFTGVINSLYSSGQPGNYINAWKLSQYINKPFLMRNYLYFKVSQPEPFGWVYFTPSLDWQYNLDDSSSFISVDFSYKIRSDSLIALTATALSGGTNTEFGMKPYRGLINLSYIYSF